MGYLLGVVERELNTLNREARFNVCVNLALTLPIEPLRDVDSSLKL